MVIYKRCHNGRKDDIRTERHAAGGVHAGHRHAGRLPPLGERLAGVAALADVGKRQPTLL